MMVLVPKRLSREEPNPADPGEDSLEGGICHLLHFFLFVGDAFG